MYGLAGSGKSTLARRLQSERGALRFTLDEWMIRLFPGLQIADPEYGIVADRVRELIWDVASQALSRGCDVVLDWNFWSTARRSWAVDRSRALGADVLLHWLSAGADEATARAERRADDGDGYFHTITPADNAHLAELMEPPAESEGLTIEHI